MSVSLLGKLLCLLNIIIKLCTLSLVIQWSTLVITAVSRLTHLFIDLLTKVKVNRSMHLLMKAAGVLF